MFKSGTHVYLNHPTAAEEAARPEGDVKNLAGVLSSDAYWSESHSKGPGLYSRMKVFADHATQVEEKAPHVGMSIRASGIAESGRKQDGLPILKELTAAESVDVVTHAGAGGMILTEAARTAEPIQTQEADVTAEELTKLQESLASQQAINAQLLERAIRGDARDEAAKILRSMTLPELAKQRVIETVLRDIPKKDGALDVAKFTEAVNAAAKDEGAYVASLTGSGNVIGMGGAPVDPVKARESKDREIQEVKDLRENGKNVFLRLVGDPKAAEAMAARGAA